jgi:hypothetical protein
MYIRCTPPTPQTPCRPPPYAIQTPCAGKCTLLSSSSSISSPQSLQDFDRQDKHKARQEQSQAILQDYQYPLPLPLPFHRTISSALTRMTLSRSAHSASSAVLPCALKSPLSTTTRRKSDNPRAFSALPNGSPARRLVSHQRSTTVTSHLASSLRPLRLVNGCSRAYHIASSTLTRFS